MWRAYMSKRERTTNQYTKFQNSRVTWLTVLTGSLRKPSCRLLKFFSKNLEKFTISGLSKISAFSELRKFQKFSGLRKFLNYLDLRKIDIIELRKFSTQERT